MQLNNSEIISDPTNTMMSLPKYIRELPRDLWNQCSAYFSMGSLLNLRQVCKLFSSGLFTTQYLRRHDVADRVASEIIQTYCTIRKNFTFDQAVVSIIDEKLTPELRHSVRFLSFNNPKRKGSADSILEGIGQVHLLFPKVQGVYFKEIQFPEGVECFFKPIASSLNEFSAINCGLTSKNIDFLNLFENLKKLNISINEGVTRARFSQLSPALEWFDLSDCDISDKTVAQLSHLTNLKVLAVSGNKKITGATFNRLPSSLEEFRCGECECSHEAFSNLNHLAKLRELFASCLELNDKMAAHFNHFTNLRVLEIPGNSAVTGATFNELSTSLETLNCDGCSLTDTSLAYLNRLTNLTELNISRNDITGLTFDQLPSSLTDFECEDCDLTDDAEKYVERYQNFEEDSEDERDQKRFLGQRIWT